MSKVGSILAQVDNVSSIIATFSNAVSTIPEQSASSEAESTPNRSAINRTSVTLRGHVNNAPWTSSVAQLIQYLILH